ncbi:tetratricopeptide repeat protein [Parabacteroides pacaensis]|uniref:tetratricopeptide repeat protein n=1 Tax=Parabacteroides pacaensis TaxID=2086575 RepID=UPI000D10B3A6|nr:hypothetical protein [Parabacteroides pacaensis]
MKRLFVLLVANLLVWNSFAQNADPNQLIKEGDEALTAKNYPVAFEKYNAYLTQSGKNDTVRIYNCAVCADKADKFADAAKYFEKSIKNNYKTEDAYVGLAKAYSDMKKGPELIATAKEGMEKFPENINLQKLVYVYCMKNGQALQKANKIKEAEDTFEQGLIIKDKKMKTNVLYSLGVLYYNAGAKTLQAATPLATSDPDKYAKEKTEAMNDFKKASEYLNEVTTIAPDNANAKKLLDAVKAAMK